MPHTGTRDRAASAPRAALSALFALLLLQSCGNPAPVAEPAVRVGSALASRQELTRAVDAAPRSLDPSLSTDIPSERVMDDLFEGLVRYNAIGELEAGMAQRWESSADGLLWTFHLRPGIQWSNGEPLRAADYVYAWRRLVNPRTASEYAQSLAPVQNALPISEGKLPLDRLGVVALDERTLQVTLESPTPYLLHLLTKSFTYALYEPAILQHGDSWVAPAHLICNGAYVLKEHVIGSRLVVEKNSRYWEADKVRITRVTYYPVDRTVQTDRYFAGDIQFTDAFAAQQVKWLRARLGEQVSSAPYLGVYMLALNMSKPPFTGNRALRQALNLAVDRDILVRHVRQGLYEPAWTLTPPLSGYAAPRPEWAELPDGERLALARKLYAQAGYSRERPLRVELSYPTDSDNLRTNEAVAAMWRANLGAEVSVRNQEFRVLLNNRRMKQLPMFHFAWIGDYPDPFTFLQLFQTGFGVNDGDYSNPRYDALLAAGNAETSLEGRYRQFAAAERMLNEDHAYIPLYYYASRHLVKPWVKGWQPNLQDRLYSRHMHILEHE